jgi:hypothetical protein
LGFPSGSIILVAGHYRGAGLLPNRRRDCHQLMCRCIRALATFKSSVPTNLKKNWQYASRLLKTNSLKEEHCDMMVDGQNGGARRHGHC